MKNGHIVYPDGTHVWYSNDEYHRVDGPAIIAKTVKYCLDENGVYYRDFNCLEGSEEEWFLHGKRHRVDGPAAVYPGLYGSEEWYLNGEPHRVDGPAIICADGYQEWWLNKKQITAEVEEWIEQLNLPPWQEWGDVEKFLFKVSFS